MNAKAFTKACYNLSLETVAKLLYVSTELEPARNYYHAALQISGRTALMLCNARHPFMAFAEPGQGVVYEAFIDLESCASAFKPHDSFTVLPADVLNAEPQPCHLSELSDAEIEQVQHWKPQRLGEIIFNHWD